MSTASPLPLPSTVDVAMQAAIDTVDDSFLVLDADDRLVAYNAAALKFFPHLADGLVIGTTFAELIRTDAEILQRRGLVEDADASVADRMQRHAR